jgi:hypothetical protein
MPQQPETPRTAIHQRNVVRKVIRALHCLDRAHPEALVRPQDIAYTENEGRRG